VTPKAELHVHLEGTAPPELTRRIARRNHLTVPEGTIGVDGRYVWDDFLHFLRVYDQAASVIRSAQDYRDITFEYLTACAREGAVYVELTASPDHAALAGLPYPDQVAGIAQGIDDARDASGRLLHGDASLLFGDRLPNVLRRQAHFLAQLDELVFGHGFGGLARARLQLARAREHTLERRAIERAAARRRFIGQVGHIPPNTTSSCLWIPLRIASGSGNAFASAAAASPVTGTRAARR